MAPTILLVTLSSRSITLYHFEASLDDTLQRSAVTAADTANNWLRKQTASRHGINRSNRPTRDRMMGMIWRLIASDSDEACIERRL